ncbi:MAG TPA: hypothetical protein VFE51_16930 [Verrucomicrobiae bacterium]|nr:hypothetical protein [Verrucomicrobiae bacterium]
MSTTHQEQPKTLGLFEQRFPGDNSLIELARRRFLEARMGPEVHASTPDQLSWFAGIRPWPDAPMVVHLPRDFDLLEDSTRARIRDLAARCASSVVGLVLHDQQALVTRGEEYLDAVRSLNRELDRVKGVRVFIEYAVGLEPAEFLDFFSGIRDLEHVSVCVDIGHVGIRAAQVAFGKNHHGQDVCTLKSQGPELPQLMPDIGDSLKAAVTVVLDLIKGLGALNKPMHFHLHDGHPLSTFSPFGVSDHLSFLAEIPLNFEYRGRRSVPTMFGPVGLEAVVQRAMKSLASARLSFTLEIHPTGQGLALGNAAPLFEHWTIKTNAERTNHWLAVLARNHSLLVKAMETASTLTV